MELHVLHCLFVKASNKKPINSSIISNSTKKRLFHLLWQPSALGNNLIVWFIPPPHHPFLYPPKKAFLSPSVWSRREYTWTLNWKESLLICFENCQGVHYSQRQTTNRMMNTFIIVNVNPNMWNIKLCLEDKSVLIHSKKAFLLPFSLAKNRIHLGTHLKEELTDFALKASRVFPLPTQAE